MEVNGTVDSDLSFNKKSEVFLIFDLHVFAWYLKNVSHSGRFAEMQWKPDAIGLSGGYFSKHLCVLGRVYCPIVSYFLHSSIYSFTFMTALSPLLSVLWIMIS